MGRDRRWAGNREAGRESSFGSCRTFFLALVQLEFAGTDLGPARGLLAETVDQKDEGMEENNFIQGLVSKYAVVP